MFPEPRRRGDPVSWPSGMAQNPRMDSNASRLPEIKYARNGGVAIAYQVVGDGDVDLVYVPEPQRAPRAQHRWEDAARTLCTSPSSGPRSTAMRSWTGCPAVPKG